MPEHDPKNHDTPTQVPADPRVDATPNVGAVDARPDVCLEKGAEEFLRVLSRDVECFSGTEADREFLVAGVAAVRELFARRTALADWRLDEWTAAAGARDAARAERDLAVMDLGLARAERDELRAELEGVAEEDGVMVKLAQERDRARAERDELRAELEEVAEEGGAVRAERDRARAERDELRAELEEVAEEGGAVRAERDELRADLGKQAELLATQEGELFAVRRWLHQERERVAAMQRHNESVQVAMRELCASRERATSDAAALLEEVAALKMERARRDAMGAHVPVSELDDARAAVQRAEARGQAIIADLEGKLETANTDRMLRAHAASERVRTIEELTAKLRRTEEVGAALLRERDELVAQLEEAHLWADRAQGWSQASHEVLSTMLKIDQQNARRMDALIGVFRLWAAKIREGLPWALALTMALVQEAPPETEDVKGTNGAAAHRAEGA
jgi:DNA repair exonuclease SbcCD ATPase subunit